MNSLYGRFGMNPISEVTRIVSPLGSEKIIKKKKCYSSSSSKW
jgi:hypothetical protein